MGYFGRPAAILLQVLGYLGTFAQHEEIQMSTGFHFFKIKRSENMFVQSLRFQLIDIAPPIARSGYNLERLHIQFIILPLPIARYGYDLEGFILTHVPLTTSI